MGFNPFFISSANIVAELEGSELSKIKAQISQVFFYGAGCSSKENIAIVYTALGSYFTAAKVEVAHDMLAAARATCGYKKGMVAILGTGSNSCLYNGNVIVENVSALGYILGDNGSGADIGKTFVKALLGGELPKEIETKFKQEYDLTTNSILDKLYKQALPNRFLASFSLFVFKHIKDPFINKMVAQRFELFFEKNIFKLIICFNSYI